MRPIGRNQTTLNLRIGTHRGADGAEQNTCDRPVSYVIEGPRKVKVDPALPSYLSPARQDQRCKAAIWLPSRSRFWSIEFTLSGRILRNRIRAALVTILVNHVENLERPANSRR